MKITAPRIRQHGTEAPPEYTKPQRDAWHTPGSDILPEPPERAPSTYFIGSGKNGVAQFMTMQGVSCTLSSEAHGATVSVYNLTMANLNHLRNVKFALEKLEVATGCAVARINTKEPDALCIEITRNSRSIVDFKTALLADSNFVGHNADNIPFVLGVDAFGNSIVQDLKKAKHTLIAGVTGGGKSVLLNSILCSMLLRACPNKLDLYLADFKQVEFEQYEGLPHLAAPIITEHSELVSTLYKLTAIMDARYKYLRDSKIGKQLPDGENRILLVIDEYADAVISSKADKEAIELPLARLLQKGRAAGIHVILCTQTPLATVIGTIARNNFTTRIALKCATTSMSKMIINHDGADHLAGDGDALLNHEKLGIIRFQGPLIDDDTIQAIVDFWKNQAPEAPEATAEPTQQRTSGGVSFCDDGSRCPDTPDDHYIYEDNSDD